VPDHDWLSLNLAVLAKRDTGLATTLTGITPSGRYSRLATARDGSPVPLYEDGTPAHSLYDPRKEALRTVNSIPADMYPVFFGLGAGYIQRYFLDTRPMASCCVIERNPGDLVSLLALIDLRELLADYRLIIVPSLGEQHIRAALVGSYLPALHGGLFMVRPSVRWIDTQDSRYRELQRSIPGIVTAISADYSVQAHFGRIWTRNFWLNLRLASRGFGTPGVDTSKTAVVTAAGPGLETHIAGLREHRERYCVVSTDTAYGALIDGGIVPDFFVSIDGQSVSAIHARGGFTPGTSVVLELCGNHDLAALATRSGVPLYFVAGNHPLSSLAARRFGIPEVDTSAGTVTLAARGFANLVGFSRIEFAGADFAYLGGKPYARGTYLSVLYGAAAGRRKPAETLFTSLLFRSDTRRSPGMNGGIDYRTDILDSYAKAFSSWASTKDQGISAVNPFDYGAFASFYCHEAAICAKKPDLSSRFFLSLLPFIAWYRRRHAGSCDGPSESVGNPVEAAIQLALRLIEGYTSLP